MINGIVFFFRITLTHCFSKLHKKIFIDTLIKLLISVEFVIVISDLLNKYILFWNFSFNSNCPCKYLEHYTNLLWKNWQQYGLKTKPRMAEDSRTC